MILRELIRIYSFTRCLMQGACAHWWQFRHNQHHVKTNIIRKDPDIAVPHVFLLGTKQPIAWAQRRRGFMPYQYQHIYFWLSE